MAKQLLKTFYMLQKMTGIARKCAIVWGVLALFCAGMKAEAPKIDGKLLFHYVQYMERWPADAELTVGAPRVSFAMPGMFEVTVERKRLGRVVGQRVYFVSSDGTHFVKGDSFAIGDKPFDAGIKRLKRQASPSVGPEDAPVTLSVFEDFQCPDCADEAKLLTGQLPAEFGKQVRIVFHDYPLVQHKWAMPAAMAGRCALRSGNDMFWKYYRWIYAHQSELNETNFPAKVAQWARDAKAGDGFSGCVANGSTQNEVKESIADALALEVQGTPTLFLNGRMLPMLFPNGQMVPPESQFTAIKWMIQFELHVIPPADACCMAGGPGN
jgi:protein-disulfide isomerase